jgi:hypothetical protein
MNDHNQSTEIDTVPCEVCLKEIPRSEAQTSEVDDYVLHFCGIDCYRKWQENEAANED